MSKNSFPNPWAQRLSPVFSSKSFVVPILHLRMWPILSECVWTNVCGLGQGLSFIFIVVCVHHSCTICWKDCCSSIELFLHLCKKITCTHLREFSILFQGIFQKGSYYAQRMAWFCSTTLMVCTVIHQQQPARGSTQHPYLPLTLQTQSYLLGHGSVAEKLTQQSGSSSHLLSWARRKASSFSGYSVHRSE